MLAKTQVFLNGYLLCFLLITVSFLTYLIIFTPDKTLLIFQLSLTYPIHGSIHIWVTAHLGEISRHLAWHLPPGIFACCLLLTTVALHFYRCYTMTEYAFFTGKVDRWGKDMASVWGNLNICPSLYWLELPCHPQVELFSISSLKVWGECTKISLRCCLTASSGWKHHKRQAIWHLHCIGEPQSSQGCHYGRGS